MRLMRPRKRASGSASSTISAGCPTLTFERLDSATSASTSSVAMSAIATTAPVTSLQPVYSLVNPSVGVEILPYCREQNIGVIVYSPMGSGLLTGTMTRERVAAFPENDWRRRSRYYQEPELTRNLGIAEVLKGIAARHGRSAGEVAIAWTLLNPAVTGAIVGGRSAAQVEGTANAASLRLTGEDIAEIDRALNP